jgi:integrase
MGLSVMRRPPKFVQGFLDRHGKPRWYFRRPGFKRTPLPGLPWSPEFMAAYEDALAGQLVLVGSTRVKPGTIRALAISYYNSLGFRSLKPSSQAIYRRIIDRFCREHGDKRAATLQREHIVKLMAARAEKPASANALHKVLRALMQHAVEIGMRADDPTRNVKVLRVKTDGYHSWTESEIEQFEARHIIGSRARLAFALLLYTGQRRSDVVRMGRQHIADGALSLRQQKTGCELWIPVHETLASIIAESSPSNLTFLVTDQGKPYSAAGFGNWFRDQCRAAGLHGCSAHGLRKAAARRLAEAGCTAHEISAITGHASLREIARYTRAVDQKKLAAAAIEKVKAGTSSVKPTAKFDKKSKIS